MGAAMSHISAPDTQEFRETRRARGWGRAGVEPSVHEMLGDPIVHLVLRRDGIGAGDVLAALAKARAALRRGVCRLCAA